MSGGSTLGIGISGLLTAKQALSTVGHNIANVGTEGYSRQRVEQTARPPERLGDFFVGTGVQVTDIKRVYDELVVQRLRTVISSQSELNGLNEIVTQVDDILGDPQLGLASALQSFFNAVQDVADDPSAVTARQVMLSEAETLVERFGVLDERLGELNADTNVQINNLVEEINGIASSIAEVNDAITTQSSGDKANDLLDKRDLLIQQLAERINVSVVAQDNGAVNVFIGSGQALVIGGNVQPLSTAASDFDRSRLEITSVNGAFSVPISSQISGGALGGLLDARSQVLDAARNRLGQLAIGLASTFNDQHKLGMDLNGALGGDFFGVPQAKVLDRQTNVGAGSVTLAQVNVENLEASDYMLTYDGSDRYTLRRLSDGQVTSIDTGGVGTFTTAVVDGFTLTISAGAAVGDSFLIQPVVLGARDIRVAITDPAQIAAALPVRTSAALSNSGEASIDGGTITSAAAYVSDNYTLVLGSDAAASADGVTNGAITDDTAGAAVDNALRYQLRINGAVVYTQDESDPLLPDLTALASVINDDTAITGVHAYVDATNNSLLFANEPSSTVPISLSEELIDTNFPSLALDAGDSVSGYFGAALTGATPVSTTTISATADRYAVFDTVGATVGGGIYTSGTAINFNGIQVTVSGAANSGDIFTVSDNSGGVSDNRNALAMADLQSALLLSGQTASYQDLYGQLVVEVGTLARRTEVNLGVQTALLEQAQASREAVSGVNLDEEAADLMRYQQAYQASAQVIAVANTMFETLLNAVRR